MGTSRTIAAKGTSFPAKTGSLPASLSSGLARNELPGLHGVRAIAVLLVVLYHLGYKVNGGLGVLAFFVLSGFLITWLLLGEREKYGDVSLRLFYMRRSLRIVPAFTCYWLAVVLIFSIIGRRIVWPQAIASLFYVNDYYQAFHGSLSTAFSHTWSLGIEEQFYLLFPIAFVRIRNPRTLAKALTGAIIAIWIWRMLLNLLIKPPDGYVYSAFDARADHLLIGCLLAVAMRYGIAVRLWRFLCSSAVFSLVSVVLLSVSMMASFRWGSIYRDRVGFYVDPLLVAALIVQLIAFPTSILWAWTNHRFTIYIGRISYGIYLYQGVIVELGSRLHGHAALLRGPATVVLTVAVASISYRIVETPFLGLKKRFEADGRVATTVGVDGTLIEDDASPTSARGTW